MRCHLFRTDPPALVAALIDESFIERWLATVTAEVRTLGERTLVDHIRRLTMIAGRVLAEGFDVVAQRDPAAADALLSDGLAVATWHGWDLPIEPLGEQDLPVEALPRGLLGADRSAEGAGVWLLDGETVALARSRTVTDDVGRE